MEDHRVSNYNKVTDEVVKKLVAICGDEYVTTSEPLRHSYMARGIMGMEAVVPEAIVRPANPEQLHTHRLQMHIRSNKLHHQHTASRLAVRRTCPFHHRRQRCRSQSRNMALPQQRTSTREATPGMSSIHLDTDHPS